MAHPINEHIRAGFDVIAVPIPSRIYCEGEEDPAGVTDLTPEFTSDVIKAANNVTKVYVQVSDTEEFGTDLLYDGEIILGTDQLDEDGTTREIVYGE
jgi:hypothetical protein